MTTIKAGMWVQTHLAAPRCCDVARLKQENVVVKGWQRAHWSFTKSIRDAKDAKTTPTLSRINPLFTEKWWLAQGAANQGRPLRNYVNATLREICAGYEPMRTSTSLRLIFLEKAIVASMWEITRKLHDTPCTKLAESFLLPFFFLLPMTLRVLYQRRFGPGDDR